MSICLLLVLGCLFDKAFAMSKRMNRFLDSLPLMDGLR